MTTCMAAKKKVETNINVMPRIGLLITVFDDVLIESADGVDTDTPFPRWTGGGIKEPPQPL